MLRKSVFQIDCCSPDSRSGGSTPTLRTWRIQFKEASGNKIAHPYAVAIESKLFMITGCKHVYFCNTEAST